MYNQVADLAKELTLAKERRVETGNVAPLLAAARDVEMLRRHRSAFAAVPKRRLVDGSGRPLPHLSQRLEIGGFYDVPLQHRPLHHVNRGRTGLALE